MPDRAVPDAPGCYRASAPAVPSHGPQQAGILTPRQSHVRLAAFDLGRARTVRPRAARA
ncbi:hypothetical protein [Streptomyces virginiae]|uniref:hypothetical protein n=1 Tax=Streptomyces virginiae TaxID=1961 RepID=UPI00341EBF15